jgi:hypothetical protein
MTAAQKLLAIGGLALAIFGMSYGLYYALFDEHQTLEGMGMSLATGFAQAAERNLPEAHDAIDDFGAIRFEYVREVHAHSHWISLSMVLFVLAIAFKRIAFGERTQLLIAVSLVCGSLLLPLGVILQTFPLGILAKAIAGVGSIAVVVGFAAVTAGLLLPE